MKNVGEFESGRPGAERTFTVGVLNMIYEIKQPVTLLRTYVDTIIMKHTKEPLFSEQLASSHLNEVRSFQKDYFELNADIKKYLPNNLITTKSDEVANKIDGLRQCLIVLDITSMDSVMKSLTELIDEWAKLVHQEILVGSL